MSPSEIAARRASDRACAAGRTRPHPHESLRAAWGQFVPLLRQTARSLAAMSAEAGFVPHLTEQFRFRYGASPSESEVRSWRRSLPALAGLLVDSGLERTEVLIEYQLPLSSMRVDAVLCGVH